MIRLNLIDAANRVSAFGSGSQINFEPAGKKKSGQKIGLTVALGVAIVLVGTAAFLMIMGVPKPIQGIIPTPVLSFLGVEDPSRGGLSMDRKSAQTTSAGGSIEKQKAEQMIEAAERHEPPERLVSEMHPEALMTKEKKAGYASFLPLEKVAYQKMLAAQVLVFINAVSPDDINFSDVVYEAPNYYFIRAVAGNPVVQRGYLERLRVASAHFQTPPLPENAPATDITAYGELTGKPLSHDQVASSFVKESEVASELNALRGLDSAGRVNLKGLTHPAVEDCGVYKRYTYRVSSKADYQAILAFMQSLQKSPVRIGVEKVEMLASPRNELSTSMRLVMYVSH